MNITDDNNNTFKNCTDNENDDNIIIIKYLLLSTPKSVILLCLIGSIIWTILEHSKANRKSKRFYTQIPCSMYHQQTIRMRKKIFSNKVNCKE